MRRGLPYIWLAGVLALLVGAPISSAGDISREQYVGRAEGICKSSLDVAKPILREAKRNLQKNKVGISGHEYIRAAGVIRASGKRIEKIPKPAADAKTLTEWQKKLEDEVLLLEKVGKELIAGRRVKAQGYLARFVHAGNLANRVVFGFGFNYCLFKVSRIV